MDYICLPIFLDVNTLTKWWHQHHWIITICWFGNYNFGGALKLWNPSRKSVCYYNYKSLLCKLNKQNKKIHKNHSRAFTSLHECRSTEVMHTRELFQPTEGKQRYPEQHKDGAKWQPLRHWGRPLVTTASVPCSGYKMRKGGGEPGKSLEKMTWGPRGGGRGRVLFVWAARVPTLTFPINEPLEGLHIGNAKHRKEAGKKRVRWKRKVVCRGTEGVIPSGLVTFLALSAGSISNTH